MATIIDFKNFSNVNKLTLNGSAIKAGKVLRLVNDYWQSGSAFYDKPIFLKPNTSFQTSFQFTLHGFEGSDGADGFVFMLQNSPEKNQAIGSTGSAFGFAGISDAIAVEFDTFNYSGNEISNNHVGVDLSGWNDDFLEVASKRVRPDLNSGKILNAWIDYNGKTDQLKVFLSTTSSKPQTPVLSTDVDIYSIVGSKAYIGFSAGTGSLANNHDILKWNMVVPDQIVRRNTNKNTLISSRSDLVEGLSDNHTLLGFAGDDILQGGSGADLLIGNAGNDTLTGGGGADQFVYNTNTAFSRSEIGRDIITDFTPEQGDKIVLDQTTFTNLNTFAKVSSNSAAATSTSELVYNQNNGALFYNPNGSASGFGTGGHFLTLTGAPPLEGNNFIIQP